MTLNLVIKGLIGVLFVVTLILLLRPLNIIKSNNESLRQTKNPAHLSHLIIPFHQRQLDLVYANLQAWNKQLPCMTPSDYSLIFFLSSSYDSEIESSLLHNFKQLSVSVQQCFKSVRVAFADIPESQDIYPIGSRLQFEYMLAGKLFQNRESFSHVMYMEPDSKPIKRNWLTVIDREQVRPPNEPFWMKGSAFRGQVNSAFSFIPYYRFHINGNALYNLQDRTFPDFYFNQVRKYLDGIQAPDAGYDADIFQFLLNHQNYAAIQRYFHRFKFANFIQNYWHSKYSLEDILRDEPETVLIHGGQDSS